MVGLVALACSGPASVGTEKKLSIAGIPDQNASNLARRYEVLENYLSQELGISVEYIPTVDYSAAVTAFKQR